MKLGIFCNFSVPHTGGSEFVIHNIAKGLSKDFGYDISVYSHNRKVIAEVDGILYLPCKKGHGLITEINLYQNDHIVVYSDSFWGWDTIVENIDKIKPGVSVALVGAYHMRENSPKTGELFKKSIDRYNIIVHADGPDRKWCIDNGLAHAVIPNGVDLSEFHENDIDFRKKYGITEKYVLLNVGNYFYGKGQLVLAHIARKLSQERNDVRTISISTSVDYQYDKVFLSRAKKIAPAKMTFLRDIPREDVVAAFKCSNVFIFPSRKEVAPLVILESRAAKLPWVSMDVGNVKDQPGGMVINNYTIDEKGYKVVDNNIIEHFVSQVEHIMEGTSPSTSRDTRGLFVESGQMNISKIDWKNIVPMYHKVFSE